jgi:hypothetical protein
MFDPRKYLTAKLYHSGDFCGRPRCQTGMRWAAKIDRAMTNITNNYLVVFIPFFELGSWCASRCRCRMGVFRRSRCEVDRFFAIRCLTVP